MKGANFFSENVGGTATDFALPQLSARGQKPGGAMMPLSMTE